MLSRKRLIPTAIASIVPLLACAGLAPAAPPASAPDTARAASPTAAPQYDHIVIALFENKDYGQIIGSGDAPYIESLASQGALFTQSYGVTHPSQGNYVALFSGDQHGVEDDTCPVDLADTPNLGSQLIEAGHTFAGYSEGLPSEGYTGCSSGDYVRKHAPWVDFDNVPASSNLPYGDFPSDYTQLPTVSFVTPDMCNDMHDCDVAQGDDWLKNNLDDYAQWAKTHNSLFIASFDEDNFSSVNQIATVMVGDHVKPGEYDQQIDHYNVLRTIEDVYGLDPLGKAADAEPITGVWDSAARTSHRPAVHGARAGAARTSPETH